MSFRVAIDIGGTFTDVVVRDPAGRLLIGKAPTDPDEMYAGVASALEVVATDLGVAAERLLRETDVVLLSTTRATNAILEGTTARTALLVTEGFPDILVLREGGKADAFDFETPFPEPYVPRRRTFEIRERIDSEGEVVVPLDVPQAHDVLGRLAGQHIEAIAVCLLWSVANPRHEQLLGELIEQRLPGVPYTLSHRLNPIAREYRRASSAAIDASLKPTMQSHLQAMADDLRRAGFDGELLVATSSGGVMHVDDFVQQPIHAVRSGPALAPVAARACAAHEADHASDGRERDLIVCDAGGTSFDVCIVRNGSIAWTREAWLGERFSGHITGFAAVDVRSVGAGGGSIAWIDEGGLLCVGPQSAGSSPGPVCYGRGGTNVTVTDAALALGYIDPAFFLGGRMGLDVQAATDALDRMAALLGTERSLLAHAIVLIAAELMVQAILEVTIHEGIDPRESRLVAGGGAAGLLIGAIARELGCPQVLLPRIAPALSASGGHFSDIVVEVTRSRFAATEQFPYDAVNETLAAIDASLERTRDVLRSRGLRQFSTEFSVEARYPAQVWELELPLAGRHFGDAGNVDRLVADFHDAHERVFAVRDPRGGIECLQWRGRLTALLDKPLPGRAGAAGPSDGAPAASRVAFFADVGAVPTAIHHGPSLSPGARIAGPAIVEEPNTTVVVPPGTFLQLTPAGNYLLEFA